MAKFFDDIFSSSGSQATDPLSAFLSSYGTSGNSDLGSSTDNFTSTSKTSLPERPLNEVKQERDSEPKLSHFTNTCNSNTRQPYLSGTSLFVGNGHGKEQTTEYVSPCVNSQGEKLHVVASKLNNGNENNVVSSELPLQGDGTSMDETGLEKLYVPEEESPDLNVAISNVVCSFSTRCHLNLKKIATESAHVIYKRENNMVNMKMRNPYCTANIWSSGKITCTGTQTEADAKVAGRKVARRLQKLGFKVQFANYRVVNVLGSCSLPFAIKLSEFAMENPRTTSYEPELHPGATYRLVNPKATLKVFSTGSITITAPCVAYVQNAVEHIYPLVLKHHIPKAKVDPRRNFEAPYQKPTSFDSKDMYERFKYKKRASGELSSDEESYGAGSDSSLEEHT